MHFPKEHTVYHKRQTDANAAILSFIRSQGEDGDKLKADSQRMGGDVDVTKDGRQGGTAQLARKMIN